jgi:hypothetical protein
MDARANLRRVREILLHPRREWLRVAGEPSALADLYFGYALWLAAIPPLAAFVKGSLIGYAAAGGVLRLDWVHGLVHALIGYGISVGLVFVTAQLVDVLARGFGAQPDLRRATQLVVYAMTAHWLAGLGTVVPFLSIPILLAGWGYTAYLMRLGLPHLHGCPEEKAAAYAATVTFLAFLMWLAGGAIARVLAGVNAALSGPSTFVS